MKKTLIALTSIAVASCAVYAVNREIAIRQYLDASDRMLKAIQDLMDDGTLKKLF